MAAAAPIVSGTVAPGYEAVRDTLRDNFARRGEWGAAVCVWHEGRIVADLWGGVARRSDHTAWTADTLATVFSSTKGLVALCFLMLADRGTLDYDAPVSNYWPEFAAQGKHAITVRCLLNHRAGLVGVDTPITLEMIEHHPEAVARVLEAQAPHWPPDTDQGYHGVTFGLYASELFRRISGESIGTFLAREVATPLGADAYLGLPATLESRVATNYPITASEKLFKVIPKLLFHRGQEGRVFRQVARGKEAAKAFAHPRETGPLGIDNFNTERVHRLELAWANAIASARGLCRIYAALANGGALDGVRLVSSAAIEPLRARQSWTECDRVLRKPLGWSQGFIKEEGAMFSPNHDSFGHPGAGGALGWCDPVNHVAIGYVLNKMDHRIRSPRARALCQAVYASIATGASAAKR
jgi:CubicO group peptidase (beta-lactamase class C family)